MLVPAPFPRLPTISGNREYATSTQPRLRASCTIDIRMHSDIRAMNAVSRQQPKAVDPPSVRLMIVQAGQFNIGSARTAYPLVQMRWGRETDLDGIRPSRTRAFASSSARQAHRVPSRTRSPRLTVRSLLLQVSWRPSSSPEADEALIEIGGNLATPGP